MQAHLRTLMVRMATESPTWGYTRIQGALKNVGHRVGRSTIARVLRRAFRQDGSARPLGGRLCRLPRQRISLLLGQERLEFPVPVLDDNMRECK